MPLKMMYITNKPEVARIAEANGVDRIWVDLEARGKCERQKNMNTVQSNHMISDVSVIREVVSKSDLLVRVNSIFDGSKEEIDEVIRRGADIVMLPYFSEVDEIKKFLDYVDGRAKTLLLLETIPAEQKIEEYMKLSGIDEVHIGLNDLHLQYHQKFMFELLSNGKVEEICNRLKPYKVPYGFGGIAKLDEGLLPARHIIAEHYRLGSSMAILSRSFYDSWLNNDIEEIERVFRFGMTEIREYEHRLEHESNEFFENNKEIVRQEVNAVLDKIAQKNKVD